MRTDRSFALSRRAAILAAAATVLIAGTPARATPRVLFVCEHGTVKSPIAREMLRARAKARGIAVDARARGIEPEEGATPETRAALHRDGIDTRREPLRRLTAADLRSADMIVMFNPLPFETSGKDVRDWTDTPSVNGSYSAAMATIGGRIDALLDELAHRAANSGRKR